jgi:hypothetical protein
VTGLFDPHLRGVVAGVRMKRHTIVASPQRKNFRLSMR